jgi:hypothetical protein
MESKFFWSAALLISLLLAAPPLRAWGWAGHVTIGKQAVAEARPAARAAVMDLLGVSSAAELKTAIEKACVWPDSVEDAPEWAWSDPLHYVNLPRGDGHYLRQRDCPDGLHYRGSWYAAELGRSATGTPLAGVRLALPPGRRPAPAFARRFSR